MKTVRLTLHLYGLEVIKTQFIELEQAAERIGNWRDVYGRNVLIKKEFTA